MKVGDSEEKGWHYTAPTLLKGLVSNRNVQ